MEAFEPILPNEIQKPVKLFEFLEHNNRYASFPNSFIALMVYMTNVAISDVLTSNLMFSKKFLVSDVLATNLMLTGLLSSFSTFRLL